MALISKAQLDKLQQKYKTDDAIGKQFDVTRQAIHQLRLKYGIEPVADRNKVRDDGIIALYKKGLSGTKIAEKLDISVSQTYRIIQAAMPKKKK